MALAFTAGEDYSTSSSEAGYTSLDEYTVGD